MSKVCSVCGRGPISGLKYKRRGMIRRKGGAGAKIVGKTLRRFLPNLQKIKIVLAGGNKKATVCVRCIKAGKVLKAA